ncbi:MAG: glycosyltransferase family 9 protein [Desulfovibrionaceae bacterium]
MAPPPILILQMQRMGDLVLTYPLILWLQRRHRDHPIWVVAEKDFFEGLMALSPKVFYIPWSGVDTLRAREFTMIVNLSHRPRAARLADELRAQRKIGPVGGGAGRPTYIQGNWQLYRASLVNNNRHNRFHWADLNALDLVSRTDMASTTWPAPIRHPHGGAEGRIGLFIGASQEDKRPPATFWAGLAEECAKRALSPILLGGPAEIPLAREIAAQVDARIPNLVGKFPVNGFAKALRGLSLLVTPDTGPMHVAAWTGIPTLNLSMGPVNPWETGPYPPGHYVLQAAMSCTGCWRCIRDRTHCRDRFTPGAVAYLAWRITQGKTRDLGKAALPGLALFETGRDTDGLFTLTRLNHPAATGGSAREAVSLFWNIAFGAHFGLWDHARAKACWQNIAQAHPRLRLRFLNALVQCSRALNRALKTQRTLDNDFWTSMPPLMRPLTGYLLLDLQNSDYATEAFARGVGMLEECIGYDA